MTKEHPIWRPNEISSEGWEAMTREEQVDWWEARPRPARPKMHMRESVGLYNDGKITDGEFVSLVLNLAAPEEIEEFVRVCPPDLLATLQHSLAAYGADEAVWPRSLHMGSHFPWVAADKIAESNRREQEQEWHGVRLLKAYFFRC